MQTLDQMLHSMLLQWELSRDDHDDPEKFAKGYADALRTLDKLQSKADGVSLFYRGT